MSEGMTDRTVVFAFGPQEWVVVTFNNLNYRGRVIRCVYDNGPHIYKVMYSDDKGDLKSEGSEHVLPIESRI